MDRVRRATCHKSLINVRCLSLKTSDVPNSHPAPEWGFDCRTTERSVVVVGSDSKKRLGRTKSNTWSSMPSTPHPDRGRLELRGGISADRPGLGVPGLRASLSLSLRHSCGASGLASLGPWCRVCGWQDAPADAETQLDRLKL